MKQGECFVRKMFFAAVLFAAGMGATVVQAQGTDSDQNTSQDTTQDTQPTSAEDTIQDIDKTTTATIRVEEVPGPMELSTFHHQSTGTAIYSANLPLNLVQLPLHDNIWGETFNGSPIDVVGEQITITSITVPDLGTSMADRVGSLSILDANGEVIATSGGGARTTTATLKLLSEKATYVMAHETTYSFDNVTLDCHSQNHDLKYFLQFNPAKDYTGAINIPVFQNNDTTRKDADETHLRVTDNMEAAPYLKITGTASFDKVTAELTTAGRFSLKTILEKAKELHSDSSHKVDDFHHLIVLRAQKPDVIVEMDTNLLEAEVVMASNTVASTYSDDKKTVTERAATLRFMEGHTFTGALSVRDISMNTDGTNGPGFVRFEYVDANGTAQLVIPTSVFSPFSFTQKCDVELASYPEKGTETETEQHWFWRNPFKVPSGRSVRLVTCTHENTHVLPNVSFTDASSILDLDFDSTTHTEHEMAEAVGQVIDHSSGTLKIHSATTSSDELDMITMGTEVGAIYGMPTEQTIHTHNDLTINSSFVIANGMGTMADIIQHAGTTTIGDATDYFRFGRGSTTDATALGAARAVYELNAGTLNVPGTLLFSNRVQVGRLTVGDGKTDNGLATATIGTLLSQPETITSGTPTLGQSLATTASGIATVEVLSDGHLKIGNDLNFIPVDKSFFYLEGGTLEATTANATFKFGDDTTKGGGLRLRGNTTSTIVGTGLTVDAVTGDGDLVIDGTVTIGELRDFRGTVEVANKTEGSTDAGVISAISGARSVIIFGNLGQNGTVGVENILKLAESCDYRGSLGFTGSFVDISSVDITTFRHAFRVQENQKVIIRLDQFADAIFAWPEDITTENAPTLVIIESGAYGGRVSFPHIPQGVKVEFHYYDPEGTDTTIMHDANQWMITTEESGATDVLEWEEPHVGGKATWIDIEFDGNSDNTGWMKLGSKNGALLGESGGEGTYKDLIEDATYFTPTYYPESQGVHLYARPYLDPKRDGDGGNDWGLRYPEIWSAAIRMTPPKASQKVIMSMGCIEDSGGSAWTGGTYTIESGDSLTLATGTVTTATTELILWRIPEGCTSTDDMIPVATASIPTSDISHVFSMVNDGTKIKVYLDGHLLTTYDHGGALELGTGLQCGLLLEEPSPAGNLCGAVSSDDGGVVDYIRFYKGELTSEAMRALSKESPAIDRNVRFVRTVTADGTWVQAGQWQRQEYTYDTTKEKWEWVPDTTTYAEPTEGTALHIYCEGEKTLTVNVVKDSANHFFSKDRTYSMLVVEPAESSTENVDATLHLVPIYQTGTVTEDDGTSSTSITGKLITSQADADNSEWMTSKVTQADVEAGKVTEADIGDYKYGSLYFTGSMRADSTSTEMTSLTLNANLKADSVETATITYEKATKPVESKVVTTTPGGSFLTPTITQTREVTQTRIAKRTVQVAGTQVVTFAPSAGVLSLDETSKVFLGVVGTGTTQEQTYIQTRTFNITRTATGSLFQDPDIENAEWSTYNYDESTGDVTVNGTKIDDFETPDLYTGWQTVIAEDAAEDTIRKTKLQMKADYSLVRGRSVVESKVLCLSGPLTGRGEAIGTTDKHTSQVSNHVWVPKFTTDSKWHLSDVTESHYPNNTDGKANGLFVKLTQIPGRLYLDLDNNQTIQAGGLFSQQAWYRYGYLGSAGTGGQAPVKAEAEDFAKAIAFQIKVPSTGATLTLDATMDEITIFRVDLPEEYTTVPTLELKNSNNNNLNITGQLITFARLADLEGALTIQEGALVHGHTTGTYAFANHTVDWLVKDSTVANLEVHGTGNVFSNSVELHDTNLILAPGATFHQSNPNGHLWMKGLTLGNGAIFNFEARGADPEANGVIFLERVILEGDKTGAEGVKNTATLYGGGDAGSGTDVNKASHFTAAGFTAEQADTTLIVQSTRVDITPTESETVADESTSNGTTANTSNLNRWICYTADFQTANGADGKPLGGFGLTKKGDGIMAFRDENPPSLSGPVRVEEGTLKVGGKAASSDALIHDSHLTNAIGHHGLHVAAGATLTRNAFTPEDYVIACLEAGQTLSGTGTIDGDVRLCSGAIVNGTDGIGMTVRRFVVDGSATSDVEVILPSDLTVTDAQLKETPTLENRPTLFFLLDDSVRTESRRRFKAAKEGETKRWDVVGEHFTTTTGTDTTSPKARYYVEPAYLPVPVLEDATGNTWDTNAKIEDTFILYYQSYGVSKIAFTYGKSNGKSLNATEIGNAFLLFSNVWTFGEPKTTTMVDQRDLLMAYELGITRETIREIESASYVVVEVSLTNTLNTQFGGTSSASGTVYNELAGGTSAADFQLGAEVRLVNQDDEAFDGTAELIKFDATTLWTNPSAALREPGKRYYAIPFNTDNFPAGATTQIRVLVTNETTSNGTGSDEQESNGQESDVTTN